MMGPPTGLAPGSQAGSIAALIIKCPVTDWPNGSNGQVHGTGSRGILQEGMHSGPCCQGKGGG